MKRVVIMVTIMFISGTVMAQQSSDQTNTGVNDTDQTGGDGSNNNANQNNNLQQSTQQLDNANAAINVNDIAIETRPTENSNIGSSSSSSSSKSSSNNSLSNAGNASVNIEGDDFPASSAIAPSINPTSPCMGSSAAGGQGMSFGVSLGSSWRDKECEKREAFRMGMESGHPEVTAMALEVYRNLEAVREALDAARPAGQAEAERAKVSTYSNAVARTGRVLP